MDGSNKKTKGFFKVFDPLSSSQKMKIPTAFKNYKGGKLPREVFLRDRYKNMWQVKVGKSGNDLVFEEGWVKFVKDNSVELGDFLIFDYIDTKSLFDFKLLGHTYCEKIGVGHPNFQVKEEVEWKQSDDSLEDENEHSEEEEEEEEEWDQSNKLDLTTINDTTINMKVSEDEYENEEEGEEWEQSVKLEDEDEHPEEEEEEWEQSVKLEDEDEHPEEEEEDEHPEEEEEEWEQSDKLEGEDDHPEEEEEDGDGESKKAPPRVQVGNHPKQKAFDHSGANIFKSGLYPQPINPYFVAKIRKGRKNELHIPECLIRDFNLKLPPKLILRDPKGKGWEAKVKTWKDGRVLLAGGWSQLCKWNLIQEEDSCICEFVSEDRGMGRKELILQIHVVHGPQT